MASKAAMLPPPPPQWVIDLNSHPVAKPKSSSLPDPPGFTPTGRVSKNVSKKGQQDQPAIRVPPTTEEMDTLKLKKAWEVAIAPAKQLPMSAIGMYMTGNSLQVFSIIMVFMLFKTPITQVLAIQPTFSRFETEGTKPKMLLVKIVYILCNALSLALGIYKVNQMGLLPTTRSDWLAWETAREPLERAFPAFAT
ncbi:transmembrane protein 85 [Venturia nashicola]|uniref:ER membrane protein complex subunit 4 n=1 Tax=Venturia nashicola TaxID=86259 RepID=A0A4Z1PDN5_9PEZI|nr:transmembrane protein 85 [Venturia nashicola]TLD36040.1 transmembrane protein 85 [Venturia nashicola]